MPACFGLSTGCTFGPGEICSPCSDSEEQLACLLYVELAGIVGVN